MCAVDKRLRKKSFRGKKLQDFRFTEPQEGFWEYIPKRCFEPHMNVFWGAHFYVVCRPDEHASFSPKIKGKEYNARHSDAVPYIGNKNVGFNNSSRKKMKH